MEEIGRGRNACPVETDLVGTVVVIDGTEAVRKFLKSDLDSPVVVLKKAGSSILAPIFEDVAGILCEQGSPASHLGIVSRELGVPCVMGVSFATRPVDGQAVRVESSVAFAGEARIWSVL